MRICERIIVARDPSEDIKGDVCILGAGCVVEILYAVSRTAL